MLAIDDVATLVFFGIREGSDFHATWRTYTTTMDTVRDIAHWRDDPQHKP